MQMVDGFPRRNRVDLYTPAENAIRAAIQAVEEAGCHELLTEAVILLGKAQGLVADFVEMYMTRVDLDLGDDHTLRFTRWAPDLALNPQYAHLADLIKAHGDRYGAIVSHKKPDGSMCEGSITFKTPLTEASGHGHQMWDVLSWEPLTLAPSLACHCGDHGFIREGKWVRA